MNDQSKYKAALAGYLHLDASQITLFWKGRVGLYAILKSLKIGKGDEVILPGFTCVVVPNAIKYIGATPIYVDVDVQTFNMDVSKVKEKINANTKAIIAQNTFGLSPDMDELIKLAKENNLKLIEDCTHGFGGTYKGKKNGTLADASFYSTQWNKPFSTGIGGIVLANDKSLINQLKQIEEESIAPTFKEIFLLRYLLFFKKYLLIPTFYWPLIKLFRWLSEKNIIPGSSEGMEINSTKMPDDFVKSMSDIQAKEGILSLKEIDLLNMQRVKRAKQYQSFLTDLGFPQKYFTEHIYLKYPLLVNDRDKFMTLAGKYNLAIGDWFLSPLHPVKGDLIAWDYQAKSCPNAEFISKHIVNLPTLINEKEFMKLKEFLSSNQQMLLK